MNLCQGVAVFVVCLALTSSQKIGGGFIGMKRVPGPGQILAKKIKEVGPFAPDLTGIGPAIGFDGGIGSAAGIHGGNFGRLQPGFPGVTRPGFSTGKFGSGRRGFGRPGISRGKFKSHPGGFGGPGKFKSGPGGFGGPGKFKSGPGGFGGPGQFENGIQGFGRPGIGPGKFKSHLRGFRGSPIVPGKLEGSPQGFNGRLKNGFGGFGVVPKKFDNGLGHGFSGIRPGKLRNGNAFGGFNGGLQDVGVNGVDPFGGISGDFGTFGFSSSNLGGNLKDHLLGGFGPVESPINVKGGFEDIDLIGIDPGDIVSDIGDASVLPEIETGGIGEVMKDLDLAGIGPENLVGSDFGSIGGHDITGFRGGNKEIGFDNHGLGNIGVNNIKEGLKNFNGHGVKSGLGGSFGVGPAEFGHAGGFDELGPSFPNTGKPKGIKSKKLKGKGKVTGHKPFISSPLLNVKAEGVGLQPNLEQGINSFLQKPIEINPFGAGPKNDFTYRTLKITQGEDGYKLHKSPHRGITGYKNQNGAHSHQHFYLGTTKHK